MLSIHRWWVWSLSRGPHCPGSKGQTIEVGVPRAPVVYSKFQKWFEEGRGGGRGSIEQHRLFEVFWAFVEMGGTSRYSSKTPDSPVCLSWQISNAETTLSDLGNILDSTAQFLQIVTCFTRLQWPGSVWWRNDQRRKGFMGGQQSDLPPPCFLPELLIARARSQLPSHHCGHSLPIKLSSSLSSSSILVSLKLNNRGVGSSDLLRYTLALGVLCLFGWLSVYLILFFCLSCMSCSS